MNILFLGDSITEGVGASAPDKKYTDLVGARLGCRVVNYGISGTRIGRQKHTSDRTIRDIDFRTRVNLMEDDADVVFVFGGTNDYGHGTLHLGDPEQFKADTFCSQLQLLIKELLQKYDRDKLCFILPLRRFFEEPLACKGDGVNELGASLGEYVDAMRKIISVYKIDYIDLYKNGFPKPLTDKGDEYTKDGLHPNDRGHEFIASCICDYIFDKFNIKK